MATSSPVLTTSFVNYSGKLIDVGSRLYVQGWGSSRPVGLHSFFLWHVERGRTGKLMVVADGFKKRIPLTLAMTWDLVVYTPAPGLAWPDMLEPWAWWRAHGWGVVIRQVMGMGPDMPGGYEMQAYKQGRARGFFFCKESWELFQTRPDALQRLLTEVLYSVLHARKSAAFGVVGDHPLPDEVYLPFVEKMRRKAKKLGIS